MHLRESMGVCANLREIDPVFNLRKIEGEVVIIKPEGLLEENKGR